MKIALIGAGSVVFTRNLLTDIFKFPELRGATIALNDIDPERLQTAGMMARWTSQQLAAGAKVEECPDLRRALEGADFVVNMVQIGMHEATLIDFEIPKKYGLKQTIADSMGIGGIFRGLRTISFLLDLAGEMGEHCPGALLLNYTNPMGILMEALYTAHPEINSVGLCHSVPYTAREIASYIGVDHEDLLYECAGINHIAWMTRLEVDGEDAYPLLFAALEDPGVYARDRVRFELMRRLVTNLPDGCCVEVPVLVDGAGLRPCYVGGLPPQCAATCAPHTAVQNLTVRAALEGKRDHVYHAAMLDRHAPSVLSLDEIAAMVDELIEAHGDFLPEGIRTSGAETRRSHYTSPS